MNPEIDDAIINNNIFSQSMNYVTRGDNHSIDISTKILTAVMNYVMHEENHSSDDVITHSNLFSLSMIHLTLQQ